MSTQNPSQSKANELLRVLSGERLKYTVRVHLPDGKVIEFQDNERPSIQFKDQDRALWLCSGEYGSAPIMRWVDGSVLLVEGNPPP